MKYLDWNNKIARHFFSSANSGKRVWLTVRRELIEKIAKENNTDFADFITAVKNGPPLSKHSQRGKICSVAYDVFNQWRDGNDQSYPIYTSYLALFVLAVTHGDSDDFSENNYYGRLRSLLDEKQSTGQYPSFDKMWELWDHLEEWSLHKNNGELGEFHLDIYGQHMHVGIPTYQVIFTADDLKKTLPDLFYQMGWSSDSSPTDIEIWKAVKRNDEKFSTRTTKRIKNASVDFQNALCNRLREELGSYDEDEVEKSKNRDRYRGQIVLCMNVDKSKKQADFSFRVRRNAGLPEDSFLLDGEFLVEPSHPTISAKIMNFDQSWEKSGSFLAGEIYQFHYCGQKYKIFTLGKRVGISDWISGEEIRTSAPFYLCVHKDIYEKTNSWGAAECNEFRELDFTGVPKHWHLFEVVGVIETKEIEEDIPSIAIDKQTRIDLRDGIRLGRGNKFFPFAPPNITVAAANYVYYTTTKSNKKNELQSLSGDINSYVLPEKLSCNEWITIIASNNKDEKNKVQRRLMLVSNKLGKIEDYKKKFTLLDCFGNILQDETDTYLQGAYISQIKRAKFFPRLPNVQIDYRRITYFLGNNPGEICNSLPEKWTPGWAIQKTKRRYKAIYLSDGTYSNKTIFSSQDILKWKQFIWCNRKIILPESKTKNKWQELLKRVENV